LYNYTYMYLLNLFLLLAIFLSCSDKQNVFSGEVSSNIKKLQGEDSNGNRIRDDYEEWVENQEVNSLQRKHLLRFGELIWILFESKDKVQKIMTFKKLSENEMCIYVNTLKRGSKYRKSNRWNKKAKSKLLNNEARLQKYIEVDKLFGGAVTVLKDDSFYCKSAMEKI